MAEPWDHLRRHLPAAGGLLLEERHHHPPVTGVQCRDGCGDRGVGQHRHAQHLHTPVQPDIVVVWVWEEEQPEEAAAGPPRESCMCWQAGHYLVNSRCFDFWAS